MSSVPTPLLNDPNAAPVNTPPAQQAQPQAPQTQTVQPTQAPPLPENWPTAAAMGDTISPRTLARNLDQTPIPNHPGGWAASILSAMNTTLAGVAAPKQVPPGGGALEGISAAVDKQREIAMQNRALQIEQQRYADQARQQQFENNATSTRLGIAVQQANAANAASAANLLHTQLLNKQLARADYQAGEDQQKSLVASDNAVLDGYQSQPVPPQVIQRDVTGDEIPGLLTSNKISSAKNHVFATGRVPTLDDNGTQKTTADGSPLFHTTYSIIGNIPDKVTINDDLKPAADFINKWNTQNVPIQNGQVLPGANFNDLYRQAQLNEATVRSINKSRNDADIADLTEQGTADALRIAPVWGAALARSGGDLRAALQYVQTNPQIRKDYPNAAASVIKSYGGGEKFQAALLDAEKTRTEDIKAQTDRQKAINEANSQNGNVTDVVKSLPMTPEVAAKIKSLPASAQNVLSQFSPSDQAGLINAAYGNEDAMKVFPARNTRNAPGQLTLQDAMKVLPQINPDYDPTRSATYAVARKDFSAGGKEAQNIKSLNTALGHMGDIWQNSGFWSTNSLVAPTMRVLGNTRANAVDVDKTQLANELAAIYKGGAPTEQEVKDQKNIIDGWSATQLRERVQEAARLTASKLDALQHQWQEASVPGAPAPFEILSPGSRNALNTILKDTPQGVPAIVNGQQQSKPQAQQPQAPPVNEVYVGGKLVGHTIGSQYVPLGGQQ